MQLACQKVDCARPGACHVRAAARNPSSVKSADAHALGPATRATCRVGLSRVCALPASLVRVEERLHVCCWVERLKVVDALAHAHKLDGDAELVDDRHDGAAARRAVELGHDDASERNGLVELARLVEHVEPRSAVKYEQHLVRLARRALPDGLVHRLQLLHERVRGVQPAGSVHDDKVDMPAHLLSRRLQVLLHHKLRLGALLERAKRCVAALGPLGELRRRGCSERVSRDQQDLGPFGREHRRELPDGRGLAGAVDPDHQHHRGGLGAGCEREVGAALFRLKQVHDALLHLFTHLRAGPDRALLNAVPHLADNLERRLGPEICCDEHLLQLLQLILEFFGRP
eukprot:126195-Chlamydomonas_euryale.AAC.6